MEKLSALGVSSKDSVESQVSAAEFILEGLYAHNASAQRRASVSPPARSNRKNPSNALTSGKNRFGGEDRITSR